MRVNLGMEITSWHVVNWLNYRLSQHMDQYVIDSLIYDSWLRFSFMPTTVHTSLYPPLSCPRSFWFKWLFYTSCLQLELMCAFWCWWCFEDHSTFERWFSCVGPARLLKSRRLALWSLGTLTMTPNTEEPVQNLHLHFNKIRSFQKMVSYSIMHVLWWVQGLRHMRWAKLLFKIGGISG